MASGSVVGLCWLFGKNSGRSKREDYPITSHVADPHQANTPGLCCLGANRGVAHTFVSSGSPAHALPFAAAPAHWQRRRRRDIHGSGQVSIRALLAAQNTYYSSHHGLGDITRKRAGGSSAAGTRSVRPSEFLSRTRIAAAPLRDYQRWCVLACA